jgi:hypothetical protein
MKAPPDQPAPIPAWKFYGGLVLTYLLGAAVALLVWIKTSAP